MLHQPLYPEHINHPPSHCSPQLNHHPTMSISISCQFSRLSLSEKTTNQYRLGVTRACEASISSPFDSPKFVFGFQHKRNDSMSTREQQRLDQGLVGKKAIEREGTVQDEIKHGELKLEKKGQKHIPVELWEMIINEVNNVSTLAKLSRVSRTLYSLTAPSLYRNLGLVYKSSTEIGIINYVEAFLKDDSLGRRFTPFTHLHRHHLRSVRSVVIVDSRRDAPHSASLHECTQKTCIRCGASRTPQEVQNRCIMSEILSEIPAFTKVSWVRGSSKLGVPEAFLDILQRKGSPKPETIQLDMSGWTSDATFLDKFDEFLGNMHGLRTLELTEISESRILGSVGNFLQSPSGKSVRALRLEVSPDIPSRARGLGKLQPYKTDTSHLLPEIESLHLKHIHTDALNSASVIASIANPNTLTTLRLIGCPFKLGSGISAFPNLKALHLSGGYQHSPELYEGLPILEELILDVDAKVERNYSGGITKYLRDKGFNMKRLGVKFTGAARAEASSARLLRGTYEKDFITGIGSYCHNLEELGLWEADLQHAEKMITKLPNLRAISFNLNSESDPTAVSSYPVNVSTAHSILSLADSITPGVNSSRGGSKLKYIKLNFEAWERLDPDGAAKSSDHIMPIMTIRTLSRKSAGKTIPQIFMIEELEQRQQFWGSAPKPAAVPIPKFWKPVTNSRYMRY